ncbi:MAG: ankyrin repeat domain-containing protein [Brachymonas sp.]|nr:ankyrin repeat domain-containing protein [Brachymonas sp.]
MKSIKRNKYLSVFYGFFLFSSAASAASIDELIATVIRNNASGVRTQIASGVNPNQQDAKGRTALTLAIHQQSEKAIPVLLQSRQVDVNALNRAGESPLMLAIITGQDELTKQLIARGAAVNKHGWAPLHYAATKGNIAIMQLLLDHDAFIDTEAPNRTTPLMMAAQYSGNEKAVQFLLEQGADPWAKNQLGMTALDFARRGANPGIIQAIQNAQRQRQPAYNVQPAQPLSPASAAELKGLPIPEEQDSTKTESLQPAQSSLEMQ